MRQSALKLLIWNLQKSGRWQGHKLITSFISNGGGNHWTLLLIYDEYSSWILFHLRQTIKTKASQVVQWLKNLPANAGVIRDVGSIPESGRSPGGGHRNPLQYSCLENPMHRGVWRDTVHGVTKSQTQLKWLSTNAPVSIIISYFSFLS